MKTAAKDTFQEHEDSSKRYVSERERERERALTDSEIDVVFTCKVSVLKENDDEISFEKGDYLIVEKVVDGDWLSGRIVRKDGGESKSGLFPKNYCKEIDKPPWVTKAAPAKVEVKAKAAFAFGMYLSLNFLRARLRRSSSFEYLFSF